jgi:hypothetical protein
LLDELALLFLAAQHAVGGVGEQRGERIDRPVKALQQLHAERDQRRTHDQRADDAPEEGAALQLRRDAGQREDEDEDEQVVHGERLLEDIGGEIADARVRAQTQGDPGAEQKAQADPDCAP